MPYSIKGHGCKLRHFLTKGKTADFVGPKKLADELECDHIFVCAMLQLIVAISSILSEQPLSRALKPVPA
jgi:hypothetical protein